MSRSTVTARFATMIALLATVASVAVGCQRKPGEVSLPTVPSTLQLREAISTTTGPDYSNTPIEPAASIATVATIVDFENGDVTMTGVVAAPSGPVAGAVVRIERLVDQGVATKDVVTGADGRYRIERIKAGRVRIRAFRVPDMASGPPVVTFASGTFEQNVAVKQYGQASIQWSLAPSSPHVSEPANIVVQVSRMTVGDDGVVRQLPVPGAAVTVTALGALQGDVVAPTVTNERGRAQIALRCVGVGPSDLQISLATGEGAKVSPPSCRERPIAPPPTLAPPVVATTVEPASTVAPVEAGSTVAPPAGPVPVVPTGAPGPQPVPIVAPSVATPAPVPAAPVPAAASPGPAPVPVPVAAVVPTVSVVAVASPAPQP